jgi:hypothetical protein
MDQLDQHEGDADGGGNRPGCGLHEAPLLRVTTINDLFRGIVTEPPARPNVAATVARTVTGG